MADKKISALDELAAAPANTDKLVIVDGSTTKYITAGNLIPAEIGIACSDETTAITTGTTAADTQKASILIPRAMTVTEVKCSLYKKTSSTVTIDVNYNAADPEAAGSTPILSAPLSMLTSALTASTTSLAISALAEDSFVTVDVDAAGTDALGLKVWLLGYWT